MLRRGHRPMFRAMGLGELLILVVVVVGVFYGVYRLGYRVGRAEGRAEAMSAQRQDRRAP